MYFHAPSNIYGAQLFRMFMDELGGVKAAHKYLGVSERTVYTWLSNGRVPRSAVLALFWESQYGRSQIFTDQVNEIRLLYRRVCLLQEQFQRAKDIIVGLRAMHAGSANEPLFEELPDFGPLHSPSVTMHSEAPAPMQDPAPVSPRARQAAKAFEGTCKVRKA